MAQTDRQADRHTDGHCNYKTKSAQWAKKSDPNSIGGDVHLGVVVGDVSINIPFLRRGLDPFWVLPKMARVNTELFLLNGPLGQFSL